MEIDYGSLVVDKENADVKYNDEVHKYWTKNTNENCISVTTLIHKFATFDEAFWSGYKTIEKMVTVDQFKEVKSELTKAKTLKKLEEAKATLGICEEDFDLVKKGILKE